MKNVKNKSIFVLLLTIVMLYFIIKDDVDDIANILRSANIFWIVIALGIYYIGLFIESISLKLITNQYSKDYSLLKAFRLNVITKFFNGITPLASGGQPLQVYELTKENIKVADGTTIIVENFLVYQTALMLLSLICYVLNIFFHFVTFTSTLRILFYLGFFFNMITLVFAYVVGINKHISKNIVLFITKILIFLRLVKKKEKVIKKLENTCEEFYNGFNEMRKNKSIIVNGFILQFIGISLTLLTSIFVFKALNIDASMSFVECISIAIFIFISGSFIPIPGGTGGMEYCFYNFFIAIAGSVSLKSSLLLWRFVTYLFPVLLGGIVFNIRSKSKIK